MNAAPIPQRLRAILEQLAVGPAELAALAALAAGALALLGLLWLRTPAADLPSGEPPTGEPTREAEPSAEIGLAVERAEVVVHVAGAVAAPGLYELPGGARVADAVAAAGGPTRDALLDRINLAREVADGEHLQVPDEASEAAGGDGHLPDGRVDLNRASSDDLERLPGVGPVTAQRIIDHREAHGPFADPRELLDVSGIGERTLEALADLVGV